MSHKNSKKISLRQTSITKSKEALKPNKFGNEIEIRGQINLPFLKERKYTSSKNLAVSSTCEIQSLHQDNRRSNISKLKKILDHKKQEALLSTENDQTKLKYFFQKRKIVIKPLDMKQMRRYSSWNKLTLLPSISDLRVQNQQSFIQNQHQEHQLATQPHNEIQLQIIQQVKRPRVQRITLRKLLKSQINKTTNPTENSQEVQNENEVQNDEKLIITKKRSRMSKCVLDKPGSKAKILVKNPFNKLPKKHSDLVQKLQILQKLDQQFIMSEIIEQEHDDSQMSVSGKNDIQTLIDLMSI